MTESGKALPEVLASRKVFTGNVFDVAADTIREDGSIYVREVVLHPGSAVIVPLFPDQTIALVRQYRHPARRYLLEVPAGALDKGETPEEGAARELEEELGFLPGKLEQLTEFFVSPGFCEEKMWVYLATDLIETAQRLDDDEIVEVVRLPFSQALRMIGTGEIEDAKTIIGLMLTASRAGLRMRENDLFTTTDPAQSEIAR
jgi:ADP-ribose pyrophosphatase